MVELKDVIRISYDASGALQHVLDIDVSTVGELPAMGDVVFGGKLLPTSTANVIQTGAWARLDDDGTWYNADGSGEVTDDSAASNLSVSPSLNLGKVKPAVLEPESFEPDELENEPDEITEPEGGEDDAELS